MHNVQIGHWRTIIYCSTYTATINEKSRQPAEGQEKTWQSTQYANGVRHIPSGIYYARLRVKGKLIWRSLKTDKISIAKSGMEILKRKSEKKRRLDTFRPPIKSWLKIAFRLIAKRDSVR